jgi:peptidoglycan/xylan/chitin deacetylase (PgdA/CDA1 family)
VLKQTVSGVAGAFGAWRVTRRLTRGVPRIFMFHRFSAGPDGHATSTDALVRFIRRVGQECEFVTLRELVDRWNRGVRYPRPLAVITVDDGYADFYTTAMPILADLKVPASLYATAGFVDGQCWLWWDALRYLLRAHPGGKLELELSHRRVQVELGDAASRRAAWGTIADELVTRNEDRRQVITQLEASSGLQLPPRPTEEFAPMNWAQLAEAESAGIEIGGHTMTHAFLPGLEAADLQREIEDAKRLVEQHLKAPLVTFAYPNGMPVDYSPDVAAAIQAAGFVAAALAHPRPFDAADRYRLGRWSAPCADPTLGHILSGASTLKLRWSGP